MKRVSPRCDSARWIPLLLARVVALILVLGGAFQAAGSGPLVRATVTMAPLGPFPRDLLDAIEAGLRDELQVEVRRHPGAALPQAAWYAPRKRYRADRLLDFLPTLIPGTPPSHRILGLTAVDISTTKDDVPDWGIFGLGTLGGKACVVSDFRLKRRVRDAAHLRFRVVTTAKHEVGHTLGLPHCTEAGCLMQDAEGSIHNTDAGSGHLGPGCRARLELLSPLPKRDG